MLSSLHIENVALIKENTLLFAEGFTVLTGETGAGKSIILDALSLLCGARSDREIIRSGESYAFVEGCFDLLDEDTIVKLKELDVCPDENGALFLSRRVSADGRSVARIGERQVPSSRLRAVAELLLNIHGQQDTLLLADKSKQLPLIDEYAKTDALLFAYREHYRHYNHLINTLKEEREKAKDASFRKEMIEFKLSSLKKAKLRPDEEAELEASRKRLRAAEKIASAASTAYGKLYEEDGSAAENLYHAMNALSALRDSLPEAAELYDRLDSVKSEVADIADTLGDLASTDADSAAAELDKVESRLELIAELKRRFGTDYEGLLCARDALLAELEQLENSDDYIKELEDEKEKCFALLTEAANALSEARKKASLTLEKQVEECLGELDMPSVRFTVEFGEITPAADGADEVEILIAPNAGEAPKPLSKIVSGGELARIMLAIRSALSETTGVSVMVFDEIDTGISGKTAQKTGLALKKLSAKQNTQVLCVTHSAQIAALADTHLLVSKYEAEGRTKSVVTALDDEGRVTELARIIGGINFGDATLLAAKELLAEAAKL